MVGHGRHSWVVPDPHDAPTAPVRTIRDVMDSPELWDRVVAAATASGVAHGEANTARRLAHGLDQPVADLVRTLAPPETFRPAGDLAARLANCLPTTPESDLSGELLLAAAASGASGRNAE